ncbi:hypothetical protein COCMIDRAFT_25194 [Bipolaris oryzae ATCC 44560]|uniref:Uncharacterized protein n=1 Tax=Bipolaris oryzae ATCC 44560 TaxID=930090 RepID=W6Z522_COCMI|nr:uncharacterized protein COCMIDRAFT_25194 [Bipolaris oryzae ATCC 44560]EUC46852.1 hypothetical protein COCMIDRAFT_25194 [Bipolaris oryzae ATCC 44560]
MLVALSPIPRASKRGYSAQPKPAVVVRVATRSSSSSSLLNWLRGYHDRGCLDHRMLHAALLCSARLGKTIQATAYQIDGQRDGKEAFGLVQGVEVGSHTHAQARCGMPVEIPRRRIGESSVLRAAAVVGKRSRLGCYPNPV